MGTTISKVDIKISGNAMFRRPTPS